MTDKYQPHQSSIALTVAIVLSLGVHALVAWLMTGKREKRERRQTISVVTRPTSQLAARPRTEPPPAPPSAMPDHPTQAPRTASQGHSARPPILDFPLLPGEKPPSVSSKLGTLPSKGGESGTQGQGGTAKGNVDLFDPNVIGKTAHTFGRPNEVTEGNSGPERGELSEAQRAQTALDAMMSDQNDRYHADKLEKPPPELAALEYAAGRNFNPPSESVAASRAKSTTDEHELGHLVTLIDVSRSPEDTEPSIIVAQPSGDKSFDDAAVLAVKQSLPKGPATYVWSRWRFSAEVYRFSRKEMLLDPGFKPPGRRLASSSGAMSMTTSVRLLKFRAQR